MELTPREVIDKLAELDALQRSWNRDLEAHARRGRSEILGRDE